MDALRGVDFGKGCYVGQEVVSRMEHRHTARRRVVMATGSVPLPPPGTEIVAADRPVGTMGSSAGGNGLALVRLDRVKDAMDKGHDVTAAGVRLALTIPAWADFAWPTTASVAGDA
jgi:folate-binding Fe-S cluster repair protein YgfZ